jgi:hypothetical protein
MATIYSTTGSDIRKIFNRRSKMITNLKKITACTVGAVLGSLFLLQNIAVSQTASNITGTWQIVKGDEGLGGTNPLYLRISHNTTSNVITGRIYDTQTSYGQCIQGFYLPSSRRLSFIRKSTVDCTSPAIQYHDGWVYPGGTILNATYHVWDSSGSSFPLPQTGLDFPVSAKKISETP